MFKQFAVLAVAVGLLIALAWAAPANAQSLEHFGVAELGAIAGGLAGYTYCRFPAPGCQQIYQLFALTEHEYDWGKFQQLPLPDGPSFYAMTLGRALGAATAVTLALPEDKRGVAPFLATGVWALAANFTTELASFVISLPGIPALIASLSADLEF